MKSLLITAPILPGKLELWTRFVDVLRGERHDAYRVAIREGGLTRIRVWRQAGPDATSTAVILYEGPAPERFLGRIATASDEFCAWFRQQLVDCHGLDLSVPPPPPPDLVIDERVPGIAMYSCSRVKVENYASWRRVMDELRPLRVEHGQVSEEILRSAEDEHEVTVLLGWRDEDRARKYYTHPDLRAGVERAGGVDGRGLTFLKPS